MLRTEFDKYGDIESIELIENEQSTTEAYITFKFSANAYLAYLDITETKKIWSKFFVQPAFSWLQPYTPQPELRLPAAERDLDQPSLEILNDDCLEKLLGFCDLDTNMRLLEVNKRFNGLVRQYGSRHIKSLGICLHNMTISRVRKALKLAGRHINTLRFLVIQYWEFKWLKKLRIENLVGNNLHELEIWDRSTQILDLIIWRPMLHNLVSLRIDAYLMKPINLQDVCPNLSRLVLNNFGYIATAKWPSLKHFASNRIPGVIMLKLLENNPQLKCIEFRADHSLQHRQLIDQLVSHRLEAMAMYNRGVDQDFSFLTSMHQLNSLKLWFYKCDPITQFFNLLNLLTQMTALRELEIGQLWMNDCDDFLQEGISVMENFSQLEKLNLSGFTLKTKTIVDIVRYVKHLKLFCIQKCNVKGLNLATSQTFVEEMSKARESHNVPLELAVDKSVHSMLEAVHTMSGTGVERIIHVHSNRISSRFIALLT